jgi:predicted Zn-dependent protease
VHGPGFSFSLPAGWNVGKSANALTARKGSSAVSVTRFTLVKPYRTKLFERVAKELDAVAEKLAAKSGATVTERTTTTVDGRRIRAYRFATAATKTRIGFVLDGRREFQLLCQEPGAAGDSDGACALLFGSFNAG